MGILSAAKSVVGWVKDANAIQQGYTVGQWVHIDNGREVLTKENKRTIDWSETAMFQDMPAQVI